MTGTLKNSKLPVLCNWSAHRLCDVPAWPHVSPDEPSIADPRALVIAMPTFCDHGSASPTKHLQHFFRRCESASSPCEARRLVWLLTSRAGLRSTASGADRWLRHLKEQPRNELVISRNRPAAIT